MRSFRCWGFFQIVGDTGIVVSPDNSQLLTEGWRQCLLADCKKLGVKARKHIENNFSVSQLAQRTFQAIQSIYDRKSIENV